eukprot:TRINITY_DN61_c0_g1_i1.p1 TRINITY_DN61_c0_g1~~TRINITY_DN61_c0_g1_i1.p1  ORF type:complete len:1021 (-),score=244.73 TRINITY_DN61_c0_g1_i1:110-3172(-)
MEVHRIAIRLAFVLLVGLYVFSDASSDSSPTVVHNCDVNSTLWGCKTGWVKGPSGARNDCRDAGRNMDWAYAPVYSQCYVLSAGEEDTPVTSYVPNEYVYINLRTTCYGYNYRGFLIYAVDANGTKVGDWALPFEAPAWTVAPWESIPGHQCAKSLMHASAQTKPYFLRFRYLGPVNGTGTVTFKTLIKWGDPNTGAFYWPNQTFQLTESSVQSTRPEFEMTNVGESCSDHCDAKDMECDEEAIGMINSPMAWSELSYAVPCNLPYVNTSGPAGYIDNATDYCYYGNKVSCDAQAEGTSRVCACQEKEASSSTALRGGLLPILLLAMLFPNKRYSAVLIAIVLLADYSAAHNWIYSNSRSPGASTAQPCKASSGMPHVQVGKNQAFSVEWLIAHGLYHSWFGLVAASDYDKLLSLTTKVKDEYLASAPTNQLVPPTGRWQRFHLKGGTGLVDGSGMANYSRMVYANESIYLSRPIITNDPNSGASWNQFMYKPEDTAEDRRVSYDNAKYPWLKAVYTFKTANTGSPDIAEFVMPERLPYGKYIWHYHWGGYLDCLDVDYVDHNVTEVYGRAPPEPRWKRIDHCVIQNPDSTWDYDGPVEILYDADICKKKCVSVGGSNCNAVQVSPFYTPQAYNFKTGLNNATLLYPQYPGHEILFPWGKQNNWNDFDGNASAPYMIDSNKNRTFCWFGTIKSFPSTVPKTGFIQTEDPDDPAFYSTCWVLNMDNIFDGYDEDAMVADTEWRFIDRCVDCDSVLTNGQSSAIPSWKLAETCRNCHDEPGQIKPAPTYPKSYHVANRSFCDGMSTGASGMVNFTYRWANHSSCQYSVGTTNVTSGNVTTTNVPLIGNNGCFKALAPFGRKYFSGGGDITSVTLDECSLLVQKDPECSSTFMYAPVASWMRGTAMIGRDSFSCTCYKKTTCCKTCSRVYDANFMLYETTTKSDPKCATGVLSSDNLFCCSASCGAGNCKKGSNQNNGFGSIGICGDAYINRSCDTFGPPCVVTNGTFPSTTSRLTTRGTTTL